MTDYPARMTLRPIERWPGKLTANRVSSQFSAPWRATLDLLDRELWHLGPAGRNAPAVLQIAMREQDFRLDGMPRANARPEHPGVILAIESTKGPLSFPCDRFVTWQDNLRAIALSLEALRKIDRYGITPNAEQYTGWKQLPAGGGGSSALSADEAERVLRDFGGEAPYVSLTEAYRRARSITHPDRNRGERAAWDAVEAAASVLRAAGKLS
ncbi:DnaJ-like chaperonin [Gordonia phage TimTam]|uniref:DnaJ-like chaperonin n=4 Tax=Nymphadoravirus nymphadora TaxID=2560507 RepID=A0A142KAT9_9CAUD|nr:molecular chaperone DnaJ [Gordonia phage Nymphadora]AMS03222.1 DnaJ-like chaperonin [Gordonia phage Nymphadora]AOE43880.1 DnaJ-like chaperonin [Gordonia phage BatStarr]QDP43342.1 DnaJ-like chaperonin [Gordonia phage Eviarto]QDP43423.1 DnaJ-like chaperonin [Gordonia phage TimTam]